VAVGSAFVNALEQARWYPPRTEIPYAIEQSAAEVYDDWEFDASREDTRSVLVPSDLFFTAAELTWNNRNGYIDAASGRSAFVDPSVDEIGPQALLVDRAWLLDFLERNELAIVWTVLAKKQIFRGHTRIGPYYKFSRAHLLLDGTFKASRGIVGYG
jgi:hypothetical protein